MMNMDIEDSLDECFKKLRRIPYSEMSKKVNDLYPVRIELKWEIEHEISIEKRKTFIGRLFWKAKQNYIPVWRTSSVFKRGLEEKLKNDKWNFEDFMSETRKQIIEDMEKHKLISRKRIFGAIGIFSLFELLFQLIPTTLIPLWIGIIIIATATILQILVMNWWFKKLRVQENEI